MNYKESLESLKKLVYEGVLETFNAVEKKVGIEDIFAYALFTNDSASYLGWAINTNSFYQSSTKKIENIQEKIGIKWYYPQFAFGSGDTQEDDLFNSKIANVLANIQKEMDDNNFLDIQSDVYETIITALKLAKTEIVKNKENDNIVFFLAIADSDAAEIMQEYSIKKINSQSCFENFQKEMKIFDEVV